MSLRNTSAAYGSGTRKLHLLLVITVLLVITLGLIASYLPEGSSAIPLLFNIHKLLGLLALAEVIIFILWTFTNPKPGYPPTMVAWERVAARSSRILLYLLVLTMTISGWILVTGAARPPHLFEMTFPLPFGLHPSGEMTGLADQIHVTTAWVLIGIIVIHAAAALRHHFIKKDNVLRRMFKAT